jgi:hypothetical protein
LTLRDSAFNIRNTFVENKKRWEDFWRIHVANSVSLATKMSVDILRAIAKHFTVEGGNEMFVWRTAHVQSYSSKTQLEVEIPTP